jgi:hypothetical protein
MQISDQNPNNVYYVSGNPINHSPLGGGGTVTVGVPSGGSVSFNIESNGYDTGTPAPQPNPSNYAQFDWRHSFTKADQDSWSQKTGATAIKVPETNGVITDPIYGYAYLNYYVWNFWWGYTSPWYVVNWVYGGSNGDATGSAGGCSFHFADPTPNEPGGGTTTQTPSTNCPPAPPPPCSCGGGSVAVGTLITLANGTQVPVQSLKLGMQLLSYDMATQQFVNTTITRFVTVTVHNEMRIQTADGRSLITDQNPAQKLYVMFPNGAWTLMPVTELKVGYQLFDPIAHTWVPITHIHYKNQGTYTMYDIYPTSPGNYIANGYLDPDKPPHI